MVRLVNVGRALLLAAAVDAVSAWQNGVHVRGLVIGGAFMFVAGLVMYEGFERWDRRRKSGGSEPPPPLPPRARKAEEPGTVDGGGGERG